MVTGIAHVEKGQTAGEVLALFVMLTLFGTIACWFMERWQSIWFPFALHVAMNFVWELFHVAPTALGGWYPFVLQNASILLAILITLRFTPSPRGRTGTPAAKASPPQPTASMRVIAATPDWP
jgi:membrane protease YdiL (CAAX protease family)